MLSAPPFKPLTKDDVADALGVSTRTVENWVKDGTLPSPRKLGNRVYWHPRTFYEWLDRVLADDPSHAETAIESEGHRQAAVAERGVDKRRRQSPASPKSEVKTLRARDQAKLDALVD